MQLRRIERWIAVVRLIAVPFAIFQVAVSTGYPAGYERAAWVATGIFAIGAAGIFLFVRLDVSDRASLGLSVAAQLFDTAVVSAYVIVRVHTDEGLVGLGEATLAARWSGETSRSCVAMI